jgi:5-keto-L-gluconate epimerase
MRFSFLFYEPIDDLDELDRRMGLLTGLGYDGVELSAFHPLPYPVESVAALAEKHRLLVVSMLSGWSYSAEGLCLSSPDAGVRDRAVGRLVDYVGRAAALRSLLVVGLMQGLRSDEPDGSKANERIAEGLSRVCKSAESQGVSLVIEPVNHLQIGFNHTVAEASALADRVGSPSLGVMLDTFHMNIEECSVVEAIRLYAAQSRHIHLCETNGGPFGSGGLDFPRVLAALDEAGYDRVVSIKVYRGCGWEEAARSSAAFLRGLGYGNFHEPSR